ncbi:MAG: DUF4258 domain-containing protein [Dehalococcoidia bacterium]|nr:DUF4258 domain-containing protein [Dehalococcoidia bacterium]
MCYTFSELDIRTIRERVSGGDYRYTAHAVKQMAERGTIRREVEQVILTGDIIEEYPGHRHGPCCLVYGRTCDWRHIHVVTSLNPVWIITAYEPDPKEWLDHRTRR